MANKKTIRITIEVSEDGAELFEAIKELSQTRYLYSGVLSAIALMEPSERAAWLERVAKKLNRAKSLRASDVEAPLEHLLIRVCPEAFLDLR